MRASRRASWLPNWLALVGRLFRIKTDASASRTHPAQRRSGMRSRTPPSRMDVFALLPGPTGPHLCGSDWPRPRLGCPSLSTWKLLFGLGVLAAPKPTWGRRNMNIRHLKSRKGPWCFSMGTWCIRVHPTRARRTGSHIPSTSSRVARHVRTTVTWSRSEGTLRNFDPWVPEMMDVDTGWWIVGGCPSLYTRLFVCVQIQGPDSMRKFYHHWREFKVPMIQRGW